MSRYFYDLADQLDNAKHGERGGIISAAAMTLGKSEQQIYRELRDVGWNSRRKVRADRGQSSMSDEELRVIAAMISESRRQNNKRLLSCLDALDILIANGMVQTALHPSTIMKLLRQRGLHPDQIQQATPHVQVRTPHPNHTWQFDVSVCVLYYLKKSKGLCVMDEKDFYKNKLENVYKIKNERVLRYLVTDHTSGAFFCRYYLTPGESQDCLIAFLYEAFAKKDNDKLILQGVPFNLTWDKGSANKSYTVQNLLDSLDVKHSAHQVGNSRAKGQVEKTHDIIERSFEGRLFMMNVQSIEELNAHLDAFQIHYNANRKHTRHQMTRDQAWRHIQPEQLRICPPREIYQTLLESKPETRKVNGAFHIEYKVSGFPADEYSVRDCENIRIGQQVQVTVNPYCAPNIFVDVENSLGETVRYEIEPLTQDFWGYNADAVDADGHHQQAKLTDVDKNRIDLGEMAYGTRDVREIDKKRKKRAVAFDGAIDPMKNIVEDNAADDRLHLPKHGKALDVKGVESIKRELKPRTMIDFLKWMRSAGYTITPEINKRLKARYSDGVLESDFERVAKELTEISPLKLVNE